MGNEQTDSNQQKYENYKEQFKRLNRALSNGFYLEAIFIAYAVIEDRTESALRHVGKYEAYVKSRGRYSVTLDSKISYIQNIAREKKHVFHRFFSDSLLEDVKLWKDARNRLIHALLKQQLTGEDVRSCAEQGATLAKTVRTRVTAVNRIIDAQIKKDKE